MTTTTTTMNLHTFFAAPEWRLTFKRTSEDKTATYFAFPEHATNKDINAKLEAMFFKTTWMDWLIIREDCEVVVYANAERYAEWKREQGDDSDSETEDDE